MAFSSTSKLQKDRKLPPCGIVVKGQECIMPGRNPCYRSRIEEILWQEKMVSINSQSSKIHICDYHIELIQSLKEKHDTARNKENATLQLPTFPEVKAENNCKEKDEDDEEKKVKKEEAFELPNKSYHKNKKKHHKCNKNKSHSHKNKKHHHKKARNESSQSTTAKHRTKDDSSNKSCQGKAFKNCDTEVSEKKGEVLGLWNSGLLDITSAEFSLPKSKSAHLYDAAKLAAFDTEMSTEESSESDIGALLENQNSDHSGNGFCSNDLPAQEKNKNENKSTLPKRKKKRQSIDSIEDSLKASHAISDINTKEMFFALDCETLMRYHQHFKLEDKVYANKAQFANDVACHFASIPVVQEEVIKTFIKTIKEDCFGRNHSP